ncbi:hypothetical protein FGF1_43170 [Flavobacteriaceae bacterium GF1]
MNKIITIVSILILGPFLVLGQKSIQASDIEIHTQLTFLKVSHRDVVNFERDMGLLRKLSKEGKLEEHFDWLTYRSDTDQYLIINFSNGLDDILTLEGYRNAFHEKGTGEAFDALIKSMADLNISVERNYIIQMLLPWSTVAAISVSEFPLATMTEYDIPTNTIEQFDVAMRQLVALLKKTDYPYPLESNRGSIGAYGTMALVWFYDDQDDYMGKNNLLNWMERHGATQTLQSIVNMLDSISESTRTYNLRYEKSLSY